MKNIFSILLLLLTTVSVCSQQFYLRGEIKDESGTALQNVNILLHSTGYVYHSGTDGSFGIVTSRQVDSITLSLDGYQKQTVYVNAEKYVTARLKMLSGAASAMRRDRLMSFTNNLTRESQKEWFTGDETYASLVENHYIDAGRYPSTSVSLNIDKASYSNIRRFLSMGAVVPPDAVRIEEMLNYFNSNYKKPDGKALFDIQSHITTCPALRIGRQG